MNIAAAFVLGLLIGWLAEWIIDWFYWRGRMRAALEENARLTNENMALVRENKNLDEESTDLKQRIASLEQESKARPPSIELTFLTDKEGNDNFQIIKGIGPSFSKRLREAGIHTFEQLSELTPQEMEEILGTLFKRFFSKDNNILARAKEFAQLKAQTR